MQISLESAACYFDVTIDALYTKKYSKYISSKMFDMDTYLEEGQDTKDDRFDAMNFADFVMEQIGEEMFYKLLPKKYRHKVKKELGRVKLTPVSVEVIEETFLEDWREVYDRDVEMEDDVEYVPHEEREPLTFSFVIQEYWHKRKTHEEIARDLNVPKSWVSKEIRRLGAGKKKNGIQHKGRKGFVMSKEQRKKRENQPHAKAVVQICPKTFSVIKEYSSQGAVERNGFRRENVRRAIKTAGLHRGYLWAFKGMEKPTIESARNRGNLKGKLQASEYKKPTKKQLKKYYIDSDMSVEECAKVFTCHPGTVARLAMEYGLKKRTEPVTPEVLHKLYVIEGISPKEIGKRFRKKESSIRTYLSRYGIKKRGASPFREVV